MEQKSWTLVRRMIGYDRLDTPAQHAWLDAFYTEDLRPFTNCFQPVMKLVGKQSVGQRTRRPYHTPKTRLRRLLDDYPAHLELNRLRALTELCRSTSPLTLKRRCCRSPKFLTLDHRNSPGPRSCPRGVGEV